MTHLTQFYMKLEEKMHAKDAEMNQIQARTQVCGIIKLIFVFIKILNELFGISLHAASL